MSTSSSSSTPVAAPKVKKVAAKKTVKKTADKVKKTASRKKAAASTPPLAVVTRDLKTIPGAVKRNPLGHLLMEKMLREAGFHGSVSTDKALLDKYSTDESIFSIRPQVVIRPRHKADVEVVVKVIGRETKRFSSLSLTPRAAGTGLGGGSLTDSIVVDMNDLNAMGEVAMKKDKITFTCEPGLMWRDLEKHLDKHGVYLPPYTSSKDICTIGGAVANNAAGPDSLRYGHCADWVESIDVVLKDGKTYTIKPLSLKDFQALIKQKHEYARIAQEVYELIVKNEAEIMRSKPKTKKNTSGYPLWNVMPQGVEAFKAGKGTFDLTRLISGSQGTIGIITSITMRAIEKQRNTALLMVPIFDLAEAADCIVKALKYNPINVEIFDALTFDMALSNPDFFKQRIHGLKYYQVMLSMYTTYHVRFARKIPEFTILITLDEETTQKTPSQEIAKIISSRNVKARVITNPIEEEMYLQIRRASFSLSKMLDKGKRPAAFLEDMTVPPENLSKFFMAIKKLFKDFNVQSAVHGHGGNGHFHFYPLLDFTNKTTPALVEKMANAFFDTAIKYKGNICGEHNDGIIRTPFLHLMYSKAMLDIFKQCEHIFDPDDIFNPGKKVNPRFDLKKSMRHTN
ncbi:MAG TPA: FAD-binding oxidoreductase [Candidatus Paceibacterota bacterium]